MKTLQVYYKNVRAAIKATHKAQKAAKREILPLMPEYSKLYK